MITREHESFENTVQKTNLWLGEIASAMGTEDRHRALLALRAVLHILRDRMTLEEIAQLSAQLPLLVRGIYFEGWSPTHKPIKEHSNEELFTHIYDAFPNEPALDAEMIIRSVFSVLARHVTGGEIQDVIDQLPDRMRGLWPQTVAK